MKFGIAAKLVTLLIVLVCTTAGVLVWRLMILSSNIVIAHEIGDLNEETRLRAREVQSLIYAARRDVVGLGRDEALQDYLDGERTGTDSLTQACLKYYSGTKQEAFLRVEIWEPGSGPDGVPKRIAPVESVQRAAPIAGAEEIVSRLLQAKPFDPYLSEIQHIPVRLANTQAEQKAHLVWCGMRVPSTAESTEDAAPPGDLIVLAAMSLDAKLPNGEASPFVTLNASPRHLAFFVSEPFAPANGTDTVDPKQVESLLFGLDETKQGHIDMQPMIANFVKIYQERQTLSELDNFVQTLLPKRRSSIPQDNELKLAKAFWFRQSDSIKDVELRRQVADALEAAAPQWAAEMPGVRVGNVRNAVTNVRILANSQQDVMRLSRKIEQLVRELPAAHGKMPIDWNNVVACQNCIIHYVLFPVRSSLFKDGSRYYGLAQAAFREEMKADVDRELANLFVPSLLIVCIVALVGLIVSMVFTRPLKKITAVAESVGRTRFDPDPSNDSWRYEIDAITDELPDGRRDEIGVLARAFKQMIEEVVQGHQRLRHLNADLDRRVKDRTSELEEANEKLKAARDKAHELNRAKDAFLASVSHELRNPLNQVSGFCQLLELTDLDQEQLADLGKIQRASEQLLALINDILDYQKIVMGGLALEPEEFEVVELLKEVRDAMEFPSREHQNELRVDWADDVGTICADKQRLRQVLINLSGNACKFTHQGIVKIHARRTASKGVKQIEFIVEDTGRGMLPEEQAKLFIPFTKLSAKQGNSTGTGLGLVISKGFCELMGGGIEMESEFGTGTKFTVTIPAVALQSGEQPKPSTDRAIVSAEPDKSNGQAPKAAIRATAEVSPLPRGRRVLVIDDDSDVRELMTRYLGSQGFDITTAANGIEGLQLAKQLKPTVITLDAMMPGLDGWAVLAALKADGETADIPVIMVTMVDNQQRGEVMGASEFIIKPIVWGRLARVLAKYTGETRERTILVIDDDPSARELLRRNLQRDGWTIVEAEHGKAALEILRRVKPAAILLDLMMPVMDGFEFLAEFGKTNGAEQIPVIVVTAQDPTSSEAESLQQRGVRVMQKGSHSQEALLREIHRRVDRLSKASATIHGET